MDDEVVEHYERVREEDRLCVGLRQLELLRTQEVLRRHLDGAEMQHRPSDRA